jgi:dephospho-CoA kinase
MLKVGLTGGIGSGKSTVCNLFKCLEVPVFNADEAGRRLLSEDKDVIGQVQHIFGQEVLVGGKPDRKKIAEIVFNSPEKLAQLNAVVHPAVRKSFNTWASMQTSKYVIDEAAILFETGIYKQLDFTVLVTAPEQLRIQRVMQRDGMDEASVKSRMKNQWSDDDKRKIANFVIVNDGIDPLLPRVMEIHNAIISKLK